MIEEKYTLNLDIVKKIFIKKENIKKGDFKNSPLSDGIRIIPLDAKIKEGVYYNIDSLADLISKTIPKGMFIIHTNINKKINYSSEEINTKEGIKQLLRIKALSKYIKDIYLGKTNIDLIHKDDFLEIMKNIKLCPDNLTEIGKSSIKIDENKIKIKIKRLNPKNIESNHNISISPDLPDKNQENEKEINIKGINIIGSQEFERRNKQTLKEYEKQLEEGVWYLDNGEQDEEIVYIDDEEEEPIFLTSKIVKALKNYMQEKTNKEEKYKDIKKGKSKRNKIIITAALAALIVLGIVVIKNINKNDRPEVSGTSIITTEDNTDEKNEFQEVTLKDLYKNIYLGDYYHIENAPLYYGSQRINKTDTLPSGEYQITAISILEKTNNNELEIKDVYYLKDNHINIQELINNLNLENNKNIKVRALVNDEIGWIDVNKDNFKLLVQQLENQNYFNKKMN